MRCSKLIATIMAMILLFAIIAPVAATDKPRSEFISINPGRHPWQDDTQNGATSPSTKVIVVAIGPIVTTVKVPATLFTKKESRPAVPTKQAPAKKQGGNK